MHGACKLTYEAPRTVHLLQPPGMMETSDELSQLSPFQPKDEHLDAEDYAAIGRDLTAIVIAEVARCRASEKP